MTPALISCSRKRCKTPTDTDRYQSARKKVVKLQLVGILLSEIVRKSVSNEHKTLKLHNYLAYYFNLYLAQFRLQSTFLSMSLKFFEAANTSCSLFRIGKLISHCRPNWSSHLSQLHPPQHLSHRPAFFLLCSQSIVVQQNLARNPHSKIERGEFVITALF